MAIANVHPALAAVRKSGAHKVKVACSDIDGVLGGKYLYQDNFSDAAVDDICHQTNPGPVTAADFQRLSEEAM